MLNEFLNDALHLLDGDALWEGLLKLVLSSSGVVSLDESREGGHYGEYGGLDDVSIELSQMTVD